MSDTTQHGSGFSKRELHERIVEILSDISRLFKPECKVTLLVRHPTIPSAHVLETQEENIGLAIDAIKELMDQSDATVFDP